VAGTLIAFVVPAPASAAPGDSVAAIVVGSFARTNVPCTASNPLPPNIPSGPGQAATFQASMIAGTWVVGASPLTPFVGKVTADLLNACASAIGNPPASAPWLLYQGSLGGATYDSVRPGGAGVNSLTSGVIAAGGRFVQAGTVAIAELSTTYTINGTVSASAVPWLAVMTVT
jgi:hypothetical protein